MEVKKMLIKNKFSLWNESQVIALIVFLNKLEIQLCYKSIVKMTLCVY